MITSRSNPLIKSLRRLSSDRRYREREGCFLVEGVHMVEEALSSGWPVRLILHTPAAAERAGFLWPKAREKNVPLVAVAEELVDELAGTVTPQGVMALVEMPRGELAVLLGAPPSLLVLVDGVQDPGNLGTIVRSAAAAGAQGVVLLPGTVDLYNPKTVRATMGALFHLPVVAVAEKEGVLVRLKEAGFAVVAGVPAGGEPLFALDLTLPVALAVGNEARGLSPEVLARSDFLATIPMPGRAESLNVAAAASIMLYEAVRQRVRKR